MPLLLFLLIITLVFPEPIRAQDTTAGGAAPGSIRQTFRQYDAALRTGDPKAVAPFWAEEYVFVSPAGERLTKAQRLQNLRASRTAFDSLAPKTLNEEFQIYGDVAVYRTITRIAGKYSGKSHAGEYRALVVLVRRSDRWQQVASQLTRIGSP